MAAALTPYKGVTYKDTKGNERPAAEAVLREGLKLGTQNHYIDGIPALFAAAELLRQPNAGNSRVEIGARSEGSELNMSDTLQGYYFVRRPCTTRTRARRGLSRYCSRFYRSLCRCGIQTPSPSTAR
jgi:hypothetical protein